MVDKYTVPYKAFVSGDDIEPTQFNADFGYIEDAINELDVASLNKVDKVTGKALSTNDLTGTLKANYDDAVIKAHSHSNSTALAKIDDTGGTDEFLTKAGTYVTAEVSNDMVLLGTKNTNFTLTANKVHTANITGNCSMALPTVSTVGQYVSCMIEFSTTNAAYPVMPTIKWDWDFTPTFSTTLKNTLIIRSTDDGATWRGSYKQGGS